MRTPHNRSCPFFCCDAGIHETRFCIAKNGFVAAAAKARQPLRTVVSEAANTTALRLITWKTLFSLHTTVTRRLIESRAADSAHRTPYDKPYGHTLTGCVRFFYDTGIHETSFCGKRRKISFTYCKKAFSVI